MAQFVAFEDEIKRGQPMQKERRDGESARTVQKVSANINYTNVLTMIQYKCYKWVAVFKQKFRQKGSGGRGHRRGGYRWGCP